jgi:GNAT superfamily N-acetyltransferase
MSQAARLSYTIRAATPDDLPAVNALYYNNEVDAGDDWAPPRRELSCFEHELRTGTMMVAERDGEALGFASSIRRGDVTYLAELFIHPERQSWGIGQALLRAVLPEEGICCTLASRDFRALALYTRAGMQPQWPHIWLRAASDEIGEMAVGGVEVVEAGTEAAEVEDWDAEISGRRRPEDVAYWLRAGQAVPVWFRRGSETLGYAYIQMRSPFSLWMPEASFIGPLGVRAAQDAAACVAAAVRWVAPRTSDVRLAVPGPHPALPSLLDAGLQIVYVETFCSSAASPIFDSRRYLVSYDVL